MREQSSLLLFRKMDLKTFINNFDFTKPDWENLPEGFPRLSKRGLTKGEEHLLDAIVIVWIFSKEGVSSRIEAYFESNKLIYAFSRSLVFKFSFSAITAFFIGIILISSLYYLNIQYKLGLTFLTEFFA